MTHARSSLARRVTLAATATALGVALVGCTEPPRAASANEAVGEELAPSIYCSEECQGQLALETDPEDIECSVGVSWSSASFPYGAKSTQQIPEFAEAFFPGMEVTVSDGQGDATTQSNQVQEMVAQGIDVLIISPQDAAALAGVVDEARDAGVGVIAADRQVDTEVETYIGSDNVEAGLVSGQAVAEALGDGAVIELAGSLGASPTIARGEGFRQGLEGSNVQLLDSQTGNYDQAEGLDVMTDLLQRYGAGQIQGVYTHNDQMAFGAIQAIEEAGRQDEIQVFSIDGEVDALAAVQDGSMAATVGYPLVVKESVIAAAKLCGDEAVDERIVLDSTLIDGSNVEDYVDQAPQ